MNDFKIKLNWQLDDQPIEQSLFILLEGIITSGSLKQACSIAGLSYRSAWGLLTKWEKRLGKPLVHMQKGRGSCLSELGDHLLRAQSQVNARFQPALENEALRIQREFERLLNDAADEKLNIFASHGLAIGVLRDQLKESQSAQIDLHFHGSLESLRALADGQCDLAGFHIPIGPLNTDLRENYLQLLDQNTIQLIYVVRRNQGLMLSKQLAKKITSLQQLADQKVRFINRQSDSGTRILFDQLLELENVPAFSIQGYENEEFTHMAVAAMIASGEADAGFGIAPMADRFQLNFQPVVWEHYCLAVAQDKLQSSAIQHLIRVLQSQEFRQKLNDYRGYQINHSGELVLFDEIFNDDIANE